MQKKFEGEIITAGNWNENFCVKKIEFTRCMEGLIR